MSAPSPRIEARALFQLLGRGETLEAIRELIAVPRETEKLLRDYASEHSEDRQELERVVEFRQLIEQEFERLYRSQGMTGKAVLEFRLAVTFAEYLGKQHAAQNCREKNDKSIYIRHDRLQLSL